jgi:hypothetical protein
MDDLMWILAITAFALVLALCIAAAIVARGDDDRPG